MNSKILSTSLIAAAGLALTPGLARATNVTANPGDLILGFEAPGSPDDLEVDLGSASRFLTATAPFNISFGVVPGTSTAVTNLNSDLGIFGSGSAWASNTSLLWGVVGSVGNQPTSNSYNIFYTQDAVDTDGYPNPGYSGSRGDNTPINNKVVSGLAGSAQDAYSTAAAAVDLTGGNSWTSQGFSFVEQQDGDPAVGSTLNLFELIPGNPASGNATDVGSFTLDSSGDVTFTPAAVPEPSTWASILGGGLFLGFFRLRRGHRAS